MGNRIFRPRRYVVEERFTRPQRLPANVDYKKLRKLILSQKLAPCFDGVDDSNSNTDLEECPICFFFYPSLNRSRCCSKGICTECFLQMNPSSAMRPAQCPFCKTSNYAVEYRGAKTEEEKGLEQAEEQKVIEAKLRMRLQESQTTDQATLPNQQLCPVEVQYPVEGSIHQSNAGWTQEVGNSNLSLSLHGRGIEASQFPFPNALSERHAEFGLNLDEAMLMEAIWRSIQNNCLQGHTQPFSGSYRPGGPQMETYGGLNQGFSYLPMIGHVESSNLVTGGVARLPERDILQSGTFQMTNNNLQTSQIQDEHFVRHQSHMPDALSHGRNMIQMGLQYSANSELCEANADNECLASCSTEDDSWDSLSSGHLHERSHGSHHELHSDEDMAKEEEFDDTSSCSSVHTISDVSYESPNCLDFYGSQNFCLSSGPIVARHQQTFTEYHS